MKDQVHYLSGLGPKDFLPSTLGLFTNGAAKLIKLVVSCCDPFDIMINSPLATADFID